jgi:hypothetical protein
MTLNPPKPSFAAPSPAAKPANTPPPTVLDHCSIAAPCDGACGQADGNARVGLCQRCGMFLYDIAGLSANAAQALTANTEGPSNGRLFKRRDGKVMTRNCPVGLEALRARLRKSAG